MFYNIKQLNTRKHSRKWLLITVIYPIHMNNLYITNILIDTTNLKPSFNQLKQQISVFCDLPGISIKLGTLSLISILSRNSIKANETKISFPITNNAIGNT